MKPNVPKEYFQRREHTGITHGHSVENIKAVMPWANDAQESIVSMSRRLTTLIIGKSANGGFRNGVRQPT